MERDQELETILTRLIVHFPTAFDLQSWLVKEVWPAYGEIVARLAASRREQAAAVANIRREEKRLISEAKWDARNRAKAEKIAAARKKREDAPYEKLRKTHMQLPNSTWYKIK
jgi:hypothetical protein